MSPRERVTKALAVITSIPQRYNEWLATLPSTNFRIQWTITAMMLTTFRYLSSDITLAIGKLSLHLGNWVPSYEWLGFMAVMAGIDSWQFKQKRDSINKELTTKQNVQTQGGSSVDRPAQEA